MFWLCFKGNKIKLLKIWHCFGNRFWTSHHTINLCQHITNWTEWLSDTRTRSEHVTGKQRLRDDVWVVGDETGNSLTAIPLHWNRWREPTTTIVHLIMPNGGTNSLSSWPNPNDFGHMWSNEDGTMTRAKETAFDDASLMPKRRWLKVTNLRWLSPASPRLAFEHLTCECVTSAGDPWTVRALACCTAGHDQLAHATDWHCPLSRDSAFEKWPKYNLSTNQHRDQSSVNSS